MILFLDFDGVLHPQPSPDEELFCRAPQLWSLLRSCPTVEIVFSTSWRHMYGFNELVSFVTAGGGKELAQRFIGTTPSILQEEGANIAGQYHRRHMECRYWLLGNRLESKAWLALDDDARTFPANSANLFLVDSATGLTDSNVDLIIDLIRNKAG